MKLLITGASGFIGSAFIRRALRTSDHTLVGLARMTNDHNLRRLTSDTPAVSNALRTGRLRMQYGDLNGDLSGICEGVDAVINFAARTYVDHSIKDSRPFVLANVNGAHNLLEDARLHKVKRFIQISTDEVYGSIATGAYTETAPHKPSNPYAASKGGADDLVISYAHTYHMHTTVTRTENNYGPFQHPQKAFPVFVGKAMRKEKLPVYGDGGHTRQWIWVDDHVDALLALLAADYPSGEVFHIAGNQEITNLELARRIIKETEYAGDPDDLIEFKPDENLRPGHDRRYALDCTKIRNLLGWDIKVPLDTGLTMAARWYCENGWWTV